MIQSVLLKNDVYWLGVLDPNLDVFDIIMERAVAVGIGEASEKTIDEINILQATKLAMKRAVEACEIKLREKLEIGEADGDAESHIIDYILEDRGYRY